MSEGPRMSRPSTYTDEIAETICERIAHGEALTKICEDKGIPAYKTVLRWRRDNEIFAKMFRAAKEDQADTLADRLLSVIDQVENKSLDPHQGRVMIDGLRWIAARLRPQSYGDRIHQEHSGAIGGEGWVNVSTLKDEAPDWLKESLETAAAQAPAKPEPEAPFPEGDDGTVH